MPMISGDYAKSGRTPLRLARDNVRLRNAFHGADHKALIAG
jgi:hypothetical protein